MNKVATFATSLLSPREASRRRLPCPLRVRYEPSTYDGTRYVATAPSPASPLAPSRRPPRRRRGCRGQTCCRELGRGAARVSSRNCFVDLARAFFAGEAAYLLSGHNQGLPVAAVNHHDNTADRRQPLIPCVPEGGATGYVNGRKYVALNHALVGACGCAWGGER